MSFEEILKLIDHVSDSALTSFKYEERSEEHTSELQSLV